MLCDCVAHEPQTFCVVACYSFGNELETSSTGDALEVSDAVSKLHSAIPISIPRFALSISSPAPFPFRGDPSEHSDRRFSNLDSVR